MSEDWGNKELDRKLLDQLVQEEEEKTEDYRYTYFSQYAEEVFEYIGRLPAYDTKACSELVPVPTEEARASLARCFEG